MRYSTLTTYLLIRPSPSVFQDSESNDMMFQVVIDHSRQTENFTEEGRCDSIHPASCDVHIQWCHICWHLCHVVLDCPHCKFVFFSEWFHRSPPSSRYLPWWRYTKVNMYCLANLDKRMCFGQRDWYIHNMYVYTVSQISIHRSKGQLKFI